MGRLELATVLLALASLTACGSGELSERQARQAVEQHLNVQLFPEDPADGAFSFEVGDVLTVTDHQREVRGRMGFVRPEAEDDPPEPVRIFFTRSSSGWALSGYGPRLTEAIAWNATNDLWRDYQEILEELSRIRTAYGDASISLLRASIDQGPAGQDSLEEYLEGATAVAVQRVVDNLDPPLPQWLVFELVDAGEQDKVLILAHDLRRDAIECLLDPEVTPVRTLPVSHLWASEWDGQACRGGAGVWLGFTGTREAVEEAIARNGTWTGW